MDIEMNYIIDSLDECIRSADSNSVSNLHSIMRIVKIGCESVISNLHKFDYDSRLKITSDLANVLSKNDFASMMVYSHYKTFPGLSGIVAGYTYKTRLISELGAQKAFEKCFYNKNIDNDMLSSYIRYISYIELLVNDKLDDLYDLPIESYTRAMMMYRNILPEFDQMLEYLRENVEADMIEYLDMHHLIGQYDEDAGDNLADLINNTDDLLSGAVFKTSTSLINYLKSNKTDDDLIKCLDICGYKYTSIVNYYTGRISDEEAEHFTKQFIKTLTETCVRSMFRRITESILLNTHGLSDMDRSVKLATDLFVIVSGIN